MDGFLDTCDAIHSWKGPEERLRILKDPHVGAFAVIGGLLYFLLAAGIWSEADIASALPLSLGFVLSRALSALAALLFPKGRTASCPSRRQARKRTAPPRFSRFLRSRGICSSASFLLQDRHAHVRWDYRRSGRMVPAAVRADGSRGDYFRQSGDDRVKAV